MIVFVLILCFLSNLECRRFIPTQKTQLIHGEKMGSFICISNFFARNIDEQVKILKMIPKPWTFVKMDSEILIYKPLSEKKQQDGLIEMLSAYGLECWSSYA